MLCERYRTHYCDEISEKDIGKKVKLAGWIDTVRDHGGVIFVDLRDERGITQIVFNEEGLIKNIHKESTISIEGSVVKRDEDTINLKLKTGTLEVLVDKIELLGSSKSELPFDIDSSMDTKEDVRLKYRFLDLRNKKVHDTILFRSKVISFLRRKMEDLGFTEITTPILTSSSPEGARDYIIPSRKHKGKFYALPQAPQQFKQLLMVSGFDKYFQIAPCFRDEDARADRSPGEFYQMDFEMSFATEEEVFNVAEDVLYDTFTKFSDKKVSQKPFIRIPYEEAMLKYGTDKPDLRNPLVITDLTTFFEDVEFTAFKGKPVRCIRVPNCSKMPKSFFEKLTQYAISIGMKGLGYIDFLEDGTMRGPIVKFLTNEKQKELVSNLDLRSFDTIFFICDAPKIVDKLAGLIRTELGVRLDLIDNNRFEFCYITDFPMYEHNSETGKIDFTHNPFSMPKGELEVLETMNPLNIKAHQYDVVCNGVELSSGAVRNHKISVMEKAFEIAGYTKEEVQVRFGALYTAFQYGAPPHAGMAPGIDRIVMLLNGNENIREVIAFPMNSNAEDLLMQSPRRS